MLSPATDPREHTSADVFVAADLSSVAGVNRVVSEMHERLGGVAVERGSPLKS